MNHETMRTGIPTLDSMLGGALPKGSLVLLRGTPASGKTTLALQILANDMSGDPKAVGALLSLQSNPGRAIAHAKAAFGISLDAPGRTGALAVAGRKEVEEAVGSAQEMTDSSLAACLSSVIARALGEERTPWQKAPFMVVIDSLDILANIVMHRLNSPTLSAAMHTVCAAVRSALGRGITLLTADHDPAQPVPSRITAKDFCYDTEILLTEEPVLPGATSLQGVAGIGAQAKLFCRVLKSAAGSRQTRRCAYDLVSGKGVVFYETYPGEGHLSLSEENAAQRSAWEELVQRDLPDLYPALSCKMVARGPLQRTFASLRCLREMPARTDMHLSSFDTYWVNWYVELCQRWDIAERIRPILACGSNPEGIERPRFSRIVGALHRKLTEWVAACKPFGETTVDEIRHLAGHVADELCIGCTLMGKAHCTGKWGKLVDALRGAWQHVSSEEGQSGLLQPIPWSELRLFGERRSPIIYELEAYRPSENRPVHRLSHRRNASKVLAVPYDANISFVVCRKDVLQKARRVRPASLASEMRRIYEEDERDLEEFVKVQGSGRKAPKLITPEVEAALKRLAEDVVGEGALPQTWEEIIALCRMSRPRLQFLIETQTFDTLLCTFLEFVWSCGGDVKVFPDYHIENREETGQRMFQAFNLLRRMFEEEIIPRHCSLDPAEVVRRFPAGDRRSAGPDWAFARHWYSTFVDLLTARKGQGEGWLWGPGDGELDVMPIPVSLSRYVEQKGRPTHVSCWGEWYLAAVRGGEDKALAVDLINNLMSTQRICDRAFRCASVPTVEEFYKMYGQAECLDLRHRPDLRLPRLSYNRLREMLFGAAKSRTQIFDYRNCMRELHPVLHLLQGSSKVSARQLSQMICEAVARIESLAGKEMLLF